MNLCLIGMMGSGKTTCGGLLSARLGLPLLDTDRAIEARAGMSVREIFAEYGEPRFREMETELLRSLAGQSLIVSCGGGLPLREENRALLRASGRVILLDRDPERIYDSLDVSGRPLAQGGREAFLTLAAERRPLYRAAADVVIGDTASAEEAVEEILRKIKDQRRNSLSR